MGIGHRWKIATVRGIPLYVGSSWVGIAVLFVFIQYSNLTDSERVTGLEALLLSAFVTVLFFGSVLLHEAAHAAMARGLDLPVMGITLVFWGGATETKAAARGAKGEFLVALVGPATTLALGGVFWVAGTLTQGVISDLLDWLAEISVLFAALNTVPGFPLDGGRMLLAAVWGITGSRRTGMRIAGYVGLAIGVATIAYAVLSFGQGNDAGFSVFIGYMGFVMVTSGRAMDHRIAIRDQLSRGTVAEAMQPPPVTVSADITLVEALDSVLRDAGDTVVPRGGRRPVGGDGLVRERTEGGRARSDAPGPRRHDPLDADPHPRGGREPGRCLGVARRTAGLRAARRCPGGITRHRRHRTLVPAGDRGTTGPRHGGRRGRTGAVGAAAPRCMIPRPLPSGATVGGDE